MNLRRVALTSTASVLLAGAALVLPACAAPVSRAYVRVGPPAPVVERIVPAPGSGYVWVPGFYRWDGRGYLWVPGRQVRPPRARAVWAPGHWTHERRGWFWVEGRWR